MKPGEYEILDADIELNKGREKRSIEVANSGDRPIQVGSHYHFQETNPALKFDRDMARGYRLNIPAGTAIRFEPGILWLRGDRIRLKTSSGFNTTLLIAYR